MTSKNLLVFGNKDYLDGYKAGYADALNNMSLYFEDLHDDFLEELDQ